jgi:ferredoxin-NADP reductase
MDGALAVGKLPIEQATLHYAARTPDLLIYRELAERCAYEVPGFEARYYVEDAAAAVDANLRVGRIDPGEICQECGDAADAAFLLSGPKAMIDAFRSQLQEIHSVRSERVLVDAWE